MADLNQQLLVCIREKTDVHPSDLEEIEGDFHNIKSIIYKLESNNDLAFTCEVIKRLKDRWHDYMDKHLDNQYMAIVEFLDSELRRLKE